MTEEQIALLRTELLTDPLVRNYAAMDDLQVVNSLNLVNRSVLIPTVTGTQIGQQVVVSEYNALTDAQRNTIRDMWGLDSVPTQTGFFREYLLSVFNAQSTTRANLIAAFSRNVSRLTELMGTPVSIGPHHVAQARA